MPFSARLQNVKLLAVLLKAISFRDVVVLRTDDTGIRFIVEEAKSLQGKSMMPWSLFHSYSMKETTKATDKSVQSQEAAQFDEISFNINSLQYCLNVFTSGLNQSTRDCALILHYGGNGTWFEIQLEENGVITVCKVATFEPLPLANFDFMQHPIMAWLIIKSEWLKEALEEFDQTSDLVLIKVQPQQPYFIISAKGSTGATRVEYSKDQDVIEYFSCDSAVEQSYHFALLKSSLRALNISQKTSLRINSQGTLCLQFMIPTGGASSVFSEYTILPSHIFQ